jgi:hypothetical protein
MKPVLIAALLLLPLAACQPTPEPKKVDQPQGRAETQGIRNTEAIGYAGDAIADKVDGALDANDQRKAELDAQLKAAEAPQ